MPGPELIAGEAPELDETRRLLYVALAGRDAHGDGGHLAVHRAELEGTLVCRLRHCHGIADDDLEKWVGYLVVRRVGADLNELGVMWARDMIARITARLETRPSPAAGTTPPGTVA